MIIMNIKRIYWILLELIKNSIILIKIYLLHDIPKKKRKLSLDYRKKIKNQILKKNRILILLRLKIKEAKLKKILYSLLNNSKINEL